ncbi:MAG: DUF3299 domain-containing protein [Pseudomonadota bacterium]
MAWQSDCDNGNELKVTGFARILTVSLVLALAQVAQASDPRVIAWTDLLPEGRVYEDPFETMTYDQLVSLSDLLRIETLPEASQTDVQKSEALEIRAELAEDGLDPDQLFEQREIVMRERKFAATEPNLGVVGNTVRLPGYLLPLEIVDGKAVEFLLVPVVGACIHVPPPPPNQIVHVQYPQGYPIVGYYDAVWISGQVRAQNSRPSLHFIDGAAEVETSYAMDAVIVESYR